MITVELTPIINITITLQPIYGVGDVVVLEPSAPITLEMQAIAKGDKGDPAPNQIFVQATEPTFAPGTVGLWVQTGLGAQGDDFTIWIEDGQ